MVKTSFKLATSGAMVLSLAACASTAALQFPTGAQAARIPVNVPMPAPQVASAAPVAALPSAVAPASATATAQAIPPGHPAPQPSKPQAPTKGPSSGIRERVVPASAKPAPASTPAAGHDQAKKLLAQDAAKAIAAPPAKAEKPASEKQLGGTVNGAKIAGKGKSYPLNVENDKKPVAAVKPNESKAKDTKKAPVLAVKTVTVKEVQPAQSTSTVVEVKPKVKAEPLPVWQAKAGTTLRHTIEDWSHTAGWDVRWEADLLDYPIDEAFSMVGKYLDVITRVFDLYKDAKRPFSVEVYPSQKLVVVKEKK